MPCELTSGSVIDCRDSIGGIKEVFISNFDNVSSFTETGGSISAITQVATKNFFKFNLEKENATAKETETSSIENGTTFYEGELTFSIKKLDVTKRNNIRLLALSRLFIIFQDNNGTYWTFGAEYGANMLSRTSEFGKAFGDMNGYNLTFSSKEKMPMYEVPASVIATLSIA